MLKWWKTVQLKEGHYKMKLAFKKENVTMPNNLCVSKQCICGLRKKFQRDANFHSEYTNSLFDVISKGLAEQVPQHQLVPQEGKVHYELCLLRETPLNSAPQSVNLSRAQI